MKGTRTLSVSTSAMISFIVFSSEMLYFFRACSNSSIVIYLKEPRLESSKMFKFNVDEQVDSFSPALILVKILKRFVQVIFSFHAIHVHCSCYELKVINCSISINISLEEKLSVLLTMY